MTVDLNLSLKYSAIVVVCNEMSKLPDCLKSLSFCDQIVVVDLDSNDGSSEIAKQFGAELYRHSRVPIVEEIRETAFNYARNDWIVHIDPDEVFPVDCVDQIETIIRQNQNAGIVRLPWRFYFKRKPLRGTVWGWQNTKQVLFHRKRIKISNGVHQANKLLGEFAEICLGESRDCIIRHHWFDSYRDFFEKHFRYLRYEGVSRYKEGKRFSWPKLFRDTGSAFKSCFFKCRGFAGGREIVLTLFYTFYVAMSHLSLRSYQKKLKRSTVKK